MVVGFVRGTALEFTKLEVGDPNARVRERKRERYPRLAATIADPIVLTVQTSGDGRRLKLLGVRVRAERRAALPFVGIPVGMAANRPAADVSALIEFLDPTTRQALLPRPLGGVWAPDDPSSLLDTAARQQFDPTIDPGQSLDLLLAAKFEGESTFHGLDAIVASKLLIPDLALNVPEVSVHMRLAGQGVTATVEFKLQNPGSGIQDFVFTES